MSSLKEILNSVLEFPLVSFFITILCGIIFVFTKSILVCIFVFGTLYLCIYGKPIFDGILFFRNKINILIKKIDVLNELLKKPVQKFPSDNHQKELMNKINKYVSQNKNFEHPWIEFKEHLVEQKEESSKEEGSTVLKEESIILKNSMQPKDFFTAAHLFRKQGINTRQLDSMSGILLGIGVFGTFLGLVFALWGIPLDDLKTSPAEAITPLLDGAAIAFVTSLVGLGCSLAFNGFLDKKMSSFYRLLHRLHSRMEKSFPFVTKEQLLLDQLKELNQQTGHLDQQTRHLESMDERIALKMGDSMEKVGQKLQEQNIQFAQTMSENMNKMLQKLEGAVSQNNQHISQEFLSNLSEKLTHGMGGFAKQQMEQVQNTLSALQNQMPKLLEDLQTSQKQNQQTTKGLIDQLNSSQQENQKKINQSLMESVTGMKNQFAQITDNLKQGMNQTLNHSSQKLENLLQNLGDLNTNIINRTQNSYSQISSLLEDAFKNLGAFTQDLQNAISEVKITANTSIKPLVAQFDQSVSQQLQIVNKNHQYSSTLNTLTQKLEDVNSSLFEMAKELPDYLKQMKDTNQECYQQWEKYAKRFEGVDQSAAELFKHIQEGFKGLSEQTNQHIHNLCKQSRTVSKVFADAVDELRENLEGILENNKGTTQGGKQFVESVGKFNKASDQFKKSVDQFQQKTNPEEAA